MVCNLCQKSQFKAPDGDCFAHLLSLLKAHYSGERAIYLNNPDYNIFPPERVTACKAKDKEIQDLKDSLNLTKSIVIDKTEASEDLFSPTLFSQNCTFLDDLVESDDDVQDEDQTEFSLIARGQPPTSTSSPLPPPTTSTTPVLLPKKITIASNTINEKNTSIRPLFKPMNHRAIPQPSKGWRTKPSKLSFTDMNNETHIHVPKTKLKTLTLVESFKRGASKAAVSETNPKKTRMESLPRVKVEVVSEDEEAIFQTPPPTSKPIANKTTTTPDDLKDFCEDCRKVGCPIIMIKGELNDNFLFQYFKMNPPHFISDLARLKKIRECRAHANKKYKLHLTPEGFWRVDFGPTPPQMKTQIYNKGNS